MTTPSAGIRILPAGNRGLLVELESEPFVVSLTERLRRTPVPGVEDVLPAARTVLVTTTPRTDLDEVRRALRTMTVGLEAHEDSRTTESEPVTIPVRYDGADLTDVADHLRMSREDVIAAHTAASWRCVFIGFAPGFAYLSCGDDRLTVPRRAQSRTVVPAGSVALAGGYGAVYPRSSPGGWQIIGTTDSPMWNLDANPPALLQPGRRVRFVDEETL
ncbi:allophanate hydrolase subunit 1 [Rhodococcus opacus M213]|uniref:Allophanate hydrolase subunit 1 n=1 Tax=Rhodococcus opacus M213 TaxID=1129896 RepID=K8XYR9_RHOOP|nr:allophanate hydrolase subunit 1 [Rhodococcus opacus]EKT82405.1 allophanate hydrolase subunit 1 [Rhodococcus opacus M213]